MKNVLAISVCICSMAGIAAAQSGKLMTVKLPASTVVGNTTLPAGDYTVREVQSIGNSGMIQFSDSKGDTATVFATEIVPGPASPDRTEIVLKSDGERLKIDQLWMADRSYGLQILK